MSAYAVTEVFTISFKDPFSGTVSRAIRRSKCLFLAKRCFAHQYTFFHHAREPAASLFAQAQDYQGGRTASDIVSHAHNLLDVHGGPPAQIQELTSHQIFDEMCVLRTGICIISFLPHLLDENAAQRNKRLATLVAIASAKDIKKLPVKLFWAVRFVVVQSI